MSIGIFSLKSLKFEGFSELYSFVRVEVLRIQGFEFFKFSLCRPFAYVSLLPFPLKWKGRSIIRKGFPFKSCLRQVMIFYLLVTFFLSFICLSGFVVLMQVPVDPMAIIVSLLESE